MKQLPYPSRRRHLPVVAFLACVSWLWSLAPASADQHLDINIKLRLQDNRLIWITKVFIITDENLIFSTLREKQPGSNGNPSAYRAMIFDKSGGSWKCQALPGEYVTKMCVAIRVINAGRFLIDYSEDVENGMGGYREQLQYFLNVTTAGCQIELVSISRHEDNKDTIYTKFDKNESYCHFL
jgi:hypothetical protein